MTLLVFRRGALALSLAMAAACLTGCSDANDEAASQGDVRQGTLALAISGQQDLSTVSKGLRDSGLAQLFDGLAPYTILAPRDEAFEALGETGAQLRDPAQQAALVAILRDHIVPGYLGPEDIEAAIAASPDGKVTMRSMGDQFLTFAREDGTITVTGEDGASARLAGPALQASNGVAIPVDAVVKRLDGADAP